MSSLRNVKKRNNPLNHSCPVIKVIPDRQAGAVTVNGLFDKNKILTNQVSDMAMR